jgi:D-alanyl-D-alanine carboxypeptidase (penicillin-binding protein 5/6)
VNANGLPDRRQLTTARDLAVLTRAIMRDYPQYYHYFGVRRWSFEGREYRNTNGLLHQGDGYDGIKTGYTNASGYNLAASAMRNGRRITTVVLGGRTSASRNAHVAELMNTGFEVERRRAGGERIQIAQTFFEQRGYGVGSDSMSGSGGAVAYASLADDDEAVGGESPTAVAYTAAPAPTVQPTRVTPPPSARVEARRPTTLTEALNATAGAERAEVRGLAANSTPPRATRPTPAPRPAAERWTVQVGAFRDEKVARDWLIEVNRRFRDQFRNAESTVAGAAGWYRSRFTGLTQAGAEAACSTLTARNVTCLVIRPD